MRKIYKIITFLLCVSIIVVSTNYQCYASAITVTEAISGYANIYDRIKTDLQENYPISGDLFTQFMDVNWRNGMGLLFNMNEVQLSSIRSAIRGYSSGGHDFTLPENATDEDIIDAASEYLTNNISVSDNSITFNDNSKNMLVYITDELMNEYNSYCYTFGMQTNADMFTSVEQYNKAREKINDANTLLGGLWFVLSNTIYVFDTTGVRDIYFKEVNSSSLTSNGNVNVKVYNADTNTVIPASAKYVWNTTEHDYVSDANVGNISNTTKYVGLEPDPKRWSDGKYLIMTSKSKTYRFFKWNHSVTTNDILYSQYYINQPVYKDFSQSQGDYTLNSQNINTVSYGDVTSYIDSYNTENGNPPPVYDINNYITQQNEQNVSGGNGGSGDNGGDNGGGSGGSGDGSIFDWLKTLGTALGNLIKGVGEFLSEIVAGLVDAVTNLLQAISTLISGVLESLTNIFSGLIEFIYAGLPDDIRNILSLALVVAILITVLKLIRGN